MYNNTQVDIQHTHTVKPVLIKIFLLFACSYKCWGVKYHSNEWWRCLEYCQRPGYTSCTDFLVFDFTSNVKRSKWVKCRLQVRISSWLIFLKTSCIKALCTCMYFEFLFSLWLVYLTILMQLDVTWLVLRLNQQKWEDQSKLCIFLCYIV